MRFSRGRWIFPRDGGAASCSSGQGGRHSRPIPARRSTAGWRLTERSTSTAGRGWRWSPTATAHPLPTWCPVILAEKILKALAVFGSHSPEDVQKAIGEGRMQHWEEGETVIVTEVKQYPLLKVCEVFMVAGDLETAWKIEAERIVPWAKSLGCTRMVGKGRKGWAKSAKSHGYDRLLVLAIKEI